MHDSLKESGGGRMKVIKKMLLLYILILYFCNALGAIIEIPTDYPTIQKGIDSAKKGDTVYVLAGIYYENLTIAKPMILHGENRETTIVDGSGIGKVISVTSDRVTIRGLTITNSSSSSSLGSAAIYLRAVTSTTIDNCIITDNDVTGIYVSKSSFNSIANNKIYSNQGYGVRLRGSLNNVISMNEIYVNSNVGVLLDQSTNCNISDNYIFENKGGIEFDRASYNIIENNKIYINTGFGIRTHSSAEKNSFIGNLILNNEIGVLMSIDSKGSHLFYHNDIIDNLKQVIIKGNLKNYWYLNYPIGGNFWSDHLRVDEFSGPYQDIPNPDGIVDEPYIVGSGNKDRYPLMKTFNIFNVLIDIMPKTFPNDFNLNSKGRLPVAILTTEEFDVVDIDIESINFAGASPVHSSLKDVDKDGDLDMILHFYREDLTTLTVDTVEAELWASTLNGFSIYGKDSIHCFSSKK